MLSVVMKNKISNDSGALEWTYCKKCNQNTNHQISKNKKNIIKMDCIYCKNLKNRGKHGVAKTKPKNGWTKSGFTVK
ncbi:MAG: hypothetical protein ABH873_07475 [Candidatus Firestonebacteria bacterium]